MKKYILWLIVFIGCTSISFGQAIGSWKAYPALQISTYNIPVGHKAYSLCNGNLFSYNTEDTEVYVFDRLNGLHDTKIQFIRYSNASQKLILVYENGNIDLIYPDNEVVNMKQLKDKNYSNLIINNVSVVNEKAYICTNFGIVVVNTDKEEFEATYDLNLNVYSCTADAHYIYLCCSENGFNIGDLNLNLLDKNNWKHTSTNFFHELTFFKGKLIGYNKSTGLFTIDQQYYTTTALVKGGYSFFSCSEDVMLTGNSSHIYLFNNVTDKQEIKQDNPFNYLVYNNGTYWASQGIKGLQPYVLSGKTLSATQSAIQPNSPIRDYFCNMHYNGNRLLIAGGDQNYNNIEREGTLMYYENDTWYNFNADNIAEQTKHQYTNTSSIAQDPKDPTHHYVSSAGHGLYEFKDLKFIKNYDETNSPLKPVINDKITDPQNYVRCDALQYDSEGNLWMVNTEVDTILVVLKPDRTWSKLYYQELNMGTNFTHILFDSKGRLWTNSKRYEKGQGGFFALDYNGTLEDTSDDIHIKRNIIINQDGVKYEPWYFNCMAQDLNNQIWVGTNEGLFVIEDPDDFIQNDDFRFTQIKIARNDGTNYADYLLNKVNISSIAIDAANRKWIGTVADGVYLVSADGQEILQHFTTDNSPLISDEIQSIAVNPQTGEVMIGTFLGLVSYMSDANTPATELDKSNVRVYPNPVKPDYNGVIAVDGLTLNAEVKITTVTGQLVYSGRANGGLFTWDGRNQSGKRVSSGVYNIISTNAEGKKAIVNRVTFIH